MAAALMASAIALPATAQQGVERYGDWSLRSLGEGLFIATTTNSAGSVFGTMCTPNFCAAILNPQIECEPGGTYPALINAPGGAFATMLECEHLDDVMLYSFDIESDLYEAMAVGGVLGIAFPMESGEFKVARFSLTGAARASARVQQLAQGRPSTDRQNANDEFTL